MITRPLIKLACPISISRILNTLLNIIAVYFVARLGLSALTTYGLAGPIYSTIYVIAISFLFVFPVRVGQFLKDKHRLSHYLFAGSCFALAIAAVVIILLLIIPYVLPYLGQSVAITQHATIFFYVIALGMPAAFISIVLNQFIITLGHAKFATLAATLQLFVGVVLIYLFTQHYSLELKGLAIGFNIAYWFRFLLNVSYLRLACREHVDLSIKRLIHFKTDFEYLIKLSWPVAAQYSSELIAAIIGTLMIGHLYAHALAAQQIATQLRVFLTIVPYSLSQANSILIGKYHQTENQYSFAHQVFKKSLWIGGGVVLLVLFFVNVFSTQYILLFTHGDSVNIIDLTRIFIYITSVTLIFDLIKYLMMGTLRGLHNTKQSMKASLISFWLAGIPLAYLFGYPLHFSAVGVRLGLLIGLAISTVILGMAYQRFMRDAT